MTTHTHKSGYVALIGRPNAGKSTLLNKIIDSKLAAVTSRPQTTRNRIFGIYDRDNVQIVFQDTPGLLEATDAMHEFMVREAQRALDDADIAIWLVDGIKGITAREKSIATKVLVNYQMPLFIAFNKMDKVPLHERILLEEGITDLQLPQDIQTFYLSALYGDGIEPILASIVAQLPEGPKFYPPDQLSDRTVRFFVEEIIREKAFTYLSQEIPYALAVKIDEMKEEPKITRISATIHVERETQKGIVVGKKGSMIKKIGTDARLELEKFLGQKVHLELFVKVSDRWRKRRERLEEFGYTDPK